MESSIMELKNINSQITQRSRQDAERFKAALESLQGENYYLRQVIFSFEATLSKGGNMAIIQQVKAELYHRHYEKHTAKKRSGTSWPTRATQPPVPTTPSVFLPDGIPLFQLDSEGTSQQSREQILDQAIAAATTTISSKFTTATSDSSPYSSDVPISPLTFADPEDNNMFPVNNNVLYKAPQLFPTTELGGGKLTRSITPLESPPMPRPFFTETGAHLAKAEYTKHGTVFDQLQSSLFPPGTLESIIRSELATPREVVNDISLLDQLHGCCPLRDPVISPGQAAITFSSSNIEFSLSSVPTTILDGEVSNDFEIATTTLGLDDDLKQDVFPSKRLRLEIQVLASAPPAVDLNIDPKIYALPHDPRIDLIPCPRLRAQLILHRKKYNIDELSKVLINGAICHGHPLDPHSWELPEVFFDRYGFLLGEEMLRHRNKIWPKKDELQLGNELGRVRHEHS
ncbi:hypothetical protein BGZ58_009077 [Dissophora ornata]|nr:hypothetical protein BGZ58_009077 [Dissophora ornata]